MAVPGEETRQWRENYISSAVNALEGNWKLEAIDNQGRDSFRLSLLPNRRRVLAMERTSRILHVLVARTAFIFVIVLCCFAAPAFASSKPCVLPDTVQSSLNKNWHGWHLLQIGELRKDDQALWREHPSNSKKCPGMSQGKFDGEHSGLVFTLVRGRSEQAVLVATLNDGSYETTVLVKPARVSYFSVVNVLPAGEYKDFYTNKRVQTRSDSVGVEAIEHSITLFYLKDGRWKSLQISD